MTRTEAEARAREILGHSEYEFSNEKHDCGHCGAVAAALLAAAEKAAEDEREAAARRAEYYHYSCFPDCKHIPGQIARDIREQKDISHWDRDAAIRARGLRLDNNSSQPGKEPKHR